MNTKKIWILAIAFGMIMSLLFLILTNNNGNTNINEQVENEEETIEEQIQEEFVDPYTLEIEEGMRAITIPVTDVTSVSQFVKPGSYVDVIAIVPVPVNDETRTRILLSDIKVLATGRTIANEVDEEGVPISQDPYQLVTLQVTLTEAMHLAFANESGVLTLMLRNQEDRTPPPNTTISLEELIKGKMPR